MVSYTSNLLLAEPAVGGDTGVWGPPLNFNELILDQKLCQSVSISFAGASTNIYVSQSQMQYLQMTLTGTPTTNVNLVLYQNMSGFWIINNQTPNNVFVVTAVGGGTGVYVGAGATTIVTSDGTNVNSPLTNYPSLPVSFSGASGSVSLTQSQMKYYQFALSGTPSSPTSLVLLAGVTGFFIINNGTPGTVFVCTSASGSSGVYLLSGCSTLVFSDGTNVRYAVDNLPVLVPNISNLRSLVSAVPALYLEGYYSLADGGEGNFLYVPTDTSSADNGGTIIVDASGHRYYRCTNGQPYSVKWFGAYGNGTTDDTTAIQSALTYAAANGGAVYFPSATYAIATDLDITSAAKPFSLVGDGIGVSVIKKIGSTHRYMFYLSTSNNVTISGLTWNVNQSGLSTAYGGIVVLQCNDVTIENCEFLDIASDGAAILGYTSNVPFTYSRLLIENCTVRGNTVAGGGFLIVDMMYSGIRGCYVDGILSTTLGIALELKNNCFACFIENSTIRNCYDGLTLGSDGTAANGPQYCSVSDCRVEATQSPIFLADASYNTISDCVVDHAGATGVGYSLVLRRVGTGTSISYNSVTGLRVYNQGNLREFVKLQAGANNNTIDVVYASQTSLAAALTLDSGVTGNKVNFGPIYPGTSATKVYSYLNDNSGNLTNYYTFARMGEWPIKTVTTTYTATDDDSTILADATGGSFTITTPIAAHRQGRQYTFKRLNSGANAVTLSSSPNIDGASTYVLSSQYAKVTIESDGTTWWIVS